VATYVVQNLYKASNGREGDTQPPAIVGLRDKK
jgi:hypothetical protein